MSIQRPLELASLDGTSITHAKSIICHPKFFRNYNNSSQRNLNYLNDLFMQKQNMITCPSTMPEDKEFLYFECMVLSDYRSVNQFIVTISKTIGTVKIGISPKDQKLEQHLITKIAEQFAKIDGKIRYEKFKESGEFFCETRRKAVYIIKANYFYRKGTVNEKTLEKLTPIANLRFLFHSSAGAKVNYKFNFSVLTPENKFLSYPIEVSPEGIVSVLPEANNNEKDPKIAKLIFNLLFAKNQHCQKPKSPRSQKEEKLPV